MRSSRPFMLQVMQSLHGRQALLQKQINEARGAREGAGATVSASWPMQCMSDAGVKQPRRLRTEGVRVRSLSSKSSGNLSSETRATLSRSMTVNCSGPSCTTLGTRRLRWTCCLSCRILAAWQQVTEQASPAISAARAHAEAIARAGMAPHAAHRDERAHMHGSWAMTVPTGQSQGSHAGNNRATLECHSSHICSLPGTTHSHVLARALWHST